MGFWLLILTSGTGVQKPVTFLKVKAVLFARDKGKITNGDYQALNDISKRTATSELTELAEKFKILTRTDTSGAGNR